MPIDLETEMWHESLRSERTIDALEARLEESQAALIETQTKLIGRNFELLAARERIFELEARLRARAP